MIGVHQTLSTPQPKDPVSVIPAVDQILGVLVFDS